ncbi:WD40-repeat-containing domain protein [Mrakia frigida]|uniref:WD40 repeat domain-containing protein n=1 Tax=Mrakia frigida TaxID=29902 RepID=UPI003FCC0EA2
MSSVDINLSNQVFDLIFHPTRNTLYAALLTGEVKAFNYDLEGEEITYEEVFSAVPSKKSCRGLALGEGGEQLFAVGKERNLSVIDTATGTIISNIANAHDGAINRVAYLTSTCLVTGDDDGVVKLWDPRIKPAGPTAVKSYNHHWDYITDFHFFEDKKQLITTSGDATLSVIDIRSSKPTPLSVSESQDDELLSCVAIKSGTKVLTGSSMGILSVWDRSKGFGDCVDRIPGHPHSIETIVPLSDDVVATGSSDGMVRIVSILPNKLMGVITHHNDFPIERLALSHDKAILGSASHDECVKLTDVRDIFDDSDDEDDSDASGDGADSDVEMGGAAAAGLDEDSDEDMAGDAEDGSESEKAEDEEEEPEEVVVVKKGREKRKEKRPANREEEERNARGAFFEDM